MDTQLYNSPQRGLRAGRFTVGYKTDIGNKRANNEDSYAVFTRPELDNKLDGLFVVADGMGGTRGGEIASNIVVNSMYDAVYGSLTERGVPASPTDAAMLLSDGIQRANAQVWAYKAEHSGYGGMGTTCVSALIYQNVLTVGHAGDSRAYLLRQGQLSQLTDDHSEVWAEVKAGRMTREEAGRSKFRNRITRAIGLGPTVDPDILSRPLEDGDVVMLCSDGLTTELDDLTIARLLAAAADPQEACDRLVDAALRHGGSDNVTLVVLHYGVFTPIATATAAPIVTAAANDIRADNQDHDEEDSTDPNQAWKRSRTKNSSGSNAQSRIADGLNARSRYREDFVEDYPSMHADGAGGAAARGISPLLFGLTLLIALGEGVGLYVLWSGQFKSKPVPAPPPKVALRPTDQPLTYRAPVTIYRQQPLWEGILLVQPDDRLLVATETGRELSITAGGTVQPIPNAIVRIPAIQAVHMLRPRFRRALDTDTELLPAPLILPAVAVDVSGNRYELNPATKAIDKYNAAGTITAANIARGALTTPSNLAVDKYGNLYVIDNHHLKKIPAAPDNGSAVTPAQPDYVPEASTPAPATNPTVEPSSAH